MPKIPDDIILKGFRSFNSRITKEYFYGYCRRAYIVLDNKYDLRNKVGMDFYSLAHEYYLQLLAYDFNPLFDRPKQMKLSAFMFKGFWFVTMDALKAYKKEFEISKTSDVDLVLQYVRSTDKEEGMLEQVADAVSKHYHDRTMAHLAWEIFVLGYKQNEVSVELGLTPSAVNQRYKKMMDEVVTPFVIENYGMGIYSGKMAVCQEIASPISLQEARNLPYSYSDNDTCGFSGFPMQSEDMENKRITPEFITTLQPDEIFVFGSNLRGIHAGGAAHMACQRFGAEMGNGVGIQGQSYAIPTMQGGVETIQPYVDEFIAYASQHPENQFLVTPIGCGIAGFEAEDIAPLFMPAVNVENILLPESFWEVLEN